MGSMPPHGQGGGRPAPPAGVGPHPPRPRAQRAAQFMPFSALTGLEELLRATEARAACQDPAPWPGDEVLEEEGRGA